MRGHALHTTPLSLSLSLSKPEDSPSPSPFFSSLQLYAYPRTNTCNFRTPPFPFPFSFLSARRKLKTLLEQKNLKITRFHKFHSKAIHLLPRKGEGSRQKFSDKTLPFLSPFSPSIIIFIHPRAS